MVVVLLFGLCFLNEVHLVAHLPGSLSVTVTEPLFWLSKHKMGTDTFSPHTHREISPEKHLRNPQYIKKLFCKRQGINPGPNSFGEKKQHSFVKGMFCF